MKYCGAFGSTSHSKDSIIILTAMYLLSSCLVGHTAGSAQYWLYSRCLQCTDEDESAAWLRCPPQSYVLFCIAYTHCPSLQFQNLAGVCGEGGCCVSRQLSVNPRSDLWPAAGLDQDQQGPMWRKCTGECPPRISSGSLWAPRYLTWIATFSDCSYSTQ